MLPACLYNLERVGKVRNPAPLRRERPVGIRPPRHFVPFQRLAAYAARAQSVSPPARMRPLAVPLYTPKRHVSICNATGIMVWRLTSVHSEAAKRTVRRE